MRSASLARRAYNLDARAEVSRFIVTHPARRQVVSLLEPLLSQLVSGPGGVIDLWQDGERALVAVVTDTCRNATNSAELVLLGHRAPPTPGPLLDALLDHAEAFARGGPRAALCLTWPPVPRAWNPTLSARGYRPSREAWLMSRALSGLPAPAPTPAGLAWVDVSEAWIPAFYETLSAAFSAIPGAYVPDLDTFRAIRLSAPIPARLLVEGGRVLAFVSVEKAGRDRAGSLNSLGRHPAASGRGLGPLAMAEGLRVLSSHGVNRARLHLTSTDQAALRLCQDFGFKRVRSIRTWRLELAGP